MTFKRFIIYCVILIITVLCIILCSGCNSQLFYYSGQLADGCTTYHYVSNGATEGNPVYGDNPSLERICIIRAIAITITELMVYLDPDNTKIYYTVGGIFGWGSAVWNISQGE